MSSSQEKYKARLELELQQDLDATELVYHDQDVAVGYKTKGITGHSNIGIHKSELQRGYNAFDNPYQEEIERLELRVAELIKERDEYDKRRRSAITLANKYKGLYDDLMEENNE